MDDDSHSRGVLLAMFWILPMWLIITSSRASSHFGCVWIDGDTMNESNSEKHFQHHSYLQIFAFTGWSWTGPQKLLVGGVNTSCSDALSLLSLAAVLKTQPPRPCPGNSIDTRGICRWEANDLVIWLLCEKDHQPWNHTCWRRRSSAMFRRIGSPYNPSCEQDAGDC